MGVLGLVFRAELRRRWKSWLILAALIALVGGVVLGATAAGRRTDSAFGRFVATYGYDVAAYSYGREPAPLAKLPGVTSVVTGKGPANGTPTCNCTHHIDVTNFGLEEFAPSDLTRVAKLVAGRLPNQSAPNEVLASFTLQRDYGVHLGTVFEVPLYGSSQFQQAVNGTGVPAGPTVSLRVVGIEAAMIEFPSGSPSYDLYTTQAFARRFNSKVAWFDLDLVRLRHGAADVPRFSAEVTNPKVGVVFASDLTSVASTTETSIHPQAVGWWVLAALAALAGIAVVSQAIARQGLLEGEENETLVALGIRRNQLVVLGMARTLAVGVAGAVGAVVLAAALSPLTPVGEARLAEPSTGFSLDTIVLPLGAVAVVALVFALGIWPAIREAGRHRRSVTPAPLERPSRLASAIGTAALSPSAVIGVRHALGRGHGRASVPVGTALFGTVLAVTALCATAVFGASLSHLTATPNLYGDRYQLQFGGAEPEVARNGLLSRLDGDSAVTGVTLGLSTETAVNRVSVSTVAGTAYKGPLLLSTADGRLPVRDGEVVLGAKTMSQAHASIGSFVHVTVPLLSGGTRVVPFRVVGIVSFPPDFPGGGLGKGAALTIKGYEDVVCPPGPAQPACRSSLERSFNYVVLASFVPGTAGHAALARYENAYPSLVSLPNTPANLVNFGEAVNFPLLLGMVLGLFGASTLVHLLVVSVARRRREIGLLKALGFVNGQVRSLVRWQATTVAVVGVVVGVPLGVAIGRVVWKAFASNLGFVPVPIVPVWVIATLVAGVVVLANLLAVGPSLAASRSRPGELMRTT